MQLISCHVFIDGLRPFTDTARQVDYIAETGLLKESPHAAAADTMMADDDDLTFGIQCLCFGWNLRHRDQHAVLDLADIKFPGLTDIDQQGLFIACIKMRLELLRTKFTHR